MFSTVAGCCAKLDLNVSYCCPVLMSVLSFHYFEPAEFIIFTKLELYAAFSSLKANFAMTDKKTTIISWNLS